MLGVPGLCVLAMSQRDYLDLVDHTGRRIHPGKRGAITGPPPAALAHYGGVGIFLLSLRKKLKDEG